MSHRNEDVIKKEESRLRRLAWAVRSRAKTQKTTLKLYLLMNKGLSFEKVSEHSVHLLVGVSFSLWRAAFLADRLGTQEARRKDATEFLRIMLEDNAITFLVDKNKKDWTFNYYIEDALYRLRDISEELPSIVGEGLVPEKNRPRDRWESLQTAYARAVDLLDGSEI